MFEKHVAAILRDTRGSRKGTLDSTCYMLAGQADIRFTAVKEETMEF